jgi:hypothetical protein
VVGFAEVNGTAKAQVFWVAQISANRLRDEELVDLIAASGGKWALSEWNRSIRQI